MLKKCLSLAVLLVGVIGFTGCTKPPPDPAAPFQGTWDTLGDDGKKNGGFASFEKDIFVYVEASKKDGGTSLEIGGQGKGFDRCAVQISSATTPGQMDFVFLEGDNQGKTRQGIFQLDGAQLKICVADLDSPRPTDFTAGDMRTLLNLERR